MLKLCPLKKNLVLGIGNWELGIGDRLTTIGCTSLSARTAIAVYAIPNYSYSKVYCLAW
ncbi:MAG: hypothetical protein F6K47_12895 [Symploca sp. SIO2E6]|nr:hypothetical protein [Symploca sp. SIO2E6]